MKLYAAIAYGAGATGDRVQFATTTYPWVLNSYVYDRKRECVDRLGYAPDHYITDSGAFSAWSLGEKIDVREYTDWCLKHRAQHPELPQLHIALDVIPGERGRIAQPEERAAGMKASLRNGDLMRSQQLPIMEVFHMYEPFEFLDELLARRQPGELVGISPRKDRPTRDRIAFIDAVFARMMEQHSIDALPPLHGLGCSSRDMIWRYPWWSVDSSTWNSMAMHGQRLQRSKRQTYDERNKVKEYRDYARFELLETWKDWTATLDALWRKRGVRYIDEPHTRQADDGSAERAASESVEPEPDGRANARS
jgi:hypothetical protein